ncbi:MAG: hypothetical protein ABEJ89_09180 [Haloarculaceae archaeon]
MDEQPLGRRAFLAASGAAFAATAGCLSLGGTPYPGETTLQDPPTLEPHPDADNPVMTAEDVSDRAFVDFVADPFVAYADDTFHLFFEVDYEADVSADIGHATSDDGLEWTYQQIVLDDPYHLAYPHVFRHGGEWYMTPDKATYQYNGIPEFRIYRADPFPDNWVLEERAVINQHFGDPTPVEYGDTWYVFSIEQETVFGTRLHYADSFVDGDWTEHPDSPIATAARNRRPAGRPVVLEDGLYFFFQDVERTYGDKVRAFRVDELTRESYSHHEIDESPILEATMDGGWRDDGMHNVDPALAYTGVENVVPVDGKTDDGVWSIGIYRH